MGPARWKALCFETDDVHTLDQNRIRRAGASPALRPRCASSAATSSTADATAFREFGLTLTHPLVLLMELRARREEAVTNVIERLAQLLIGRFARICHVLSVDGVFEFYA